MNKQRAGTQEEYGEAGMSRQADPGRSKRQAGRQSRSEQQAPLPGR